jgi:formylglycine-generating enzyme required for sulfatase activity
MKDIYGGVFTMGSNSLTGNPDQKVAALEHEVTWSMYSISETEITNEQYVSFLNAAFVDGLIEIVTGIGGLDVNKRVIQRTAFSTVWG